VNDYDALRDHLKKQTPPRIRADVRADRGDRRRVAAARRAPRVVWETLRSPQEKMPQREACLAAGYIATRLADGKSVRFKADEVRKPTTKRPPRSSSPPTGRANGRPMTGSGGDPVFQRR